VRHRRPSRTRCARRPCAEKGLPNLRLAFVILLVAALLPAIATGQEFEPRAYSPAPVGLNFMAFGYGHATGAVFMDPALPVDDVDGNVNIAFARYVRTLKIFGNPSKLKVLLPWSSGHWDGFLEGEFRTRDTSGFGDIRVAVETLFTEVDASTSANAKSDPPKTIWGARLQVAMPTGEYEGEKAINLGANRWTVIPEFGFSYPVGRWSLEAALGAWLFTTNDDFFGGQRLEQDPLLVAKFHAVRSIRPGFWWAIATGYGYGGRTTVDGIPRATIQRNWRVSAMLAYPFTPTQGVSVSVMSGGNAGAGTDADAITVAYQIVWRN